MQMYDAETLTQLEHASYELHRRAPERTVGNDQLDRLRELVRDALEELMESDDVDAELRGFLSRHLYQMLAAIDDFKIRGIVALEESLDQAVGHFWREPGVTTRLQEHETLWEKTRRVLSALAITVTTAASVVQLPAGVQQVLDGPDQPQVVVIDVQPSPSGQTHAKESRPSDDGDTSPAG